jgi:hypothetical protein
MFRLFSLFGVACLAAAAVALTTPTTPKVVRRERQPARDTNRRSLAVAVPAKARPLYSTRFSVN